jgi:DNA-binding GntR family transcriptional regulator
MQRHKLPRKPAAAGSVPETVAGRIRSKILRGSLAPGDRLSEYSISRELNIGQPTVREALLLLAQQGLVRRIARSGTFVTRLDPREVRDLFQIRGEIEVLAAGLAAGNAGPDDLAELRRYAEEMRAAAPGPDKWAYLQADLAFHQKIWSLSGNEQLTRMLEMVVVPLLACAAPRWRRTSDEVAESAAAHFAIVDAIGKSKSAARTAMRRHIEGFLRKYLMKTLGFDAREGTNPR